MELWLERKVVLGSILFSQRFHCPLLILGHFQKPPHLTWFRIWLAAKTTSLSTRPAEKPMPCRNLPSSALPLSTWGKPGKSALFAASSVRWNSGCRRSARRSKRVLGQIRRSWVVASAWMGSKREKLPEFCLGSRRTGRQAGKNDGELCCGWSGKNAGDSQAAILTLPSRTCN